MKPEFRARYNQARLGLAALFLALLAFVVSVEPGPLPLLIAIALASAAGFALVQRGLRCPHCAQPVLKPGGEVSSGDRFERIDLSLFGVTPGVCERCGRKLYKDKVDEALEELNQ